MASTIQPSSTAPLTSSSTTHQNQIPTLSNLPPQSNNPKKRPLNYDNLLQNSPYFKIRAVLQELRPLFLEVIRAPDFQNCDAARTIQERMKLMVDICRVHVFNTSSGIATEKSADQRLQEKRLASGNNLERASNQNPGAYHIVGGSAFGWNYITFLGAKPMYYGRTKEAFRAGK